MYSENNKFLLHIILSAVLLIALAACLLVRVWQPAAIIPPLNIPNMVLLSLIALLLDHYVAPGAKRCYICIPVFSALAFGLIPWAACFVGGGEAMLLALVGGATFTLITWLFSSIQDRLASGPQAKAAPVMSALGLWLAAQAMVGILL